MTSPDNISGNQLKKFFYITDYLIRCEEENCIFYRLAGWWAWAGGEQFE